MADPAMTPYKWLTILDTEPVDDGGKALNDNFTGLADNLGPSVMEIRDPIATDDINLGYYVWSKWVNTITGVVFVCTDNTATAAVWLEIGGGSVAGETTQVQFNLDGAFGASENFTFDPATGKLELVGAIGVNTVPVAGKPLLIRQTTDGQGLSMNSADAQTGVDLYANDTGFSGLEASSHLYLSAAGITYIQGSQIDLQFNSTGYVTCFRATSGNPYFQVYGHNGITAVFGSLRVSGDGDFVITPPDGQNVIINSPAVVSGELEATDGINVPFSDVPIRVGPNGDAGIIFDSYLRVHAPTGIRIEEELGINANPVQNRALNVKQLSDNQGMRVLGFNSLGTFVCWVDADNYVQFRSTGDRLYMSCDGQTHLDGEAGVHINQGIAADVDVFTGAAVGERTFTVHGESKADAFFYNTPRLMKRAIIPMPPPDGEKASDPIEIQEGVVAYEHPTNIDAGLWFVSVLDGTQVDTTLGLNIGVVWRYEGVQPGTVDWGISGAGWAANGIIPASSTLVSGPQSPNGSNTVLTEFHLPLTGLQLDDPIQFSFKVFRNRLSADDTLNDLVYSLGFFAGLYKKRLS